MFENFLVFVGAIGINLAAFGVFVGCVYAFHVTHKWVRKVKH